ncbi:MAG: DUF4149 domain-containing protein [Ignavibacteriae bacterium]|nr:DUF4149 domain-containing protein [Ignavibacteriota bacterium]MCB9216258.1 DUF4149 domain-containing protein [Ignavibacteria bacterium]
MFRGLLHIVAILALGILVGSLLFFGTGVASVIFRDGLLPSRTLAGVVNGAIIHRLAVTQGLVATIAVLSLGYLALVTPRSTSRVATGFALVSLLCTLYAGLILLPEISQLRFEIADFDHILEAKKGAHERFGVLHSRYTFVAMIQLLSGTLALILHSLWVWRRGSNRVQEGGLQVERGTSKGEKGSREGETGTAERQSNGNKKQETHSESSENVTKVEETPEAS